MPYIAINVTEKLSDTQKEKIKAEFGRLIMLIPTKTEARTLVDFSDCRTMYKDGRLIAGAFIELRLWHASEFENKKQFTEQTFTMLARELGLAPENIYLNIAEFEHWGADGTYNV